MSDLETKQRKLSDDMLLNKLQEQHLKNSSNVDSDSRKLSQNKEAIKQQIIRTENFKENLNKNNNIEKEEIFKITTINEKNFSNESQENKKSFYKETDKNNYVKILNETSLNTNLITDNGKTSIINNSLVEIKKSNKNNFYSSSTMFKLIKIFFMYLFQYLKKHKAIVCLLAFLFLLMKRKFIIHYVKKMLGY